MKKWLRRGLILVFLWIVSQYCLGPATVPPGDKRESVSQFTRQIEFDYVTWTIRAAWLKLEQAGLGLPSYIEVEDQHQVVLQYLSLIQEIQSQKNQLEVIYADPAISDPESVARATAVNLMHLLEVNEWLGPLAESILQEQVSQIAKEQGLTLGGQPVPPILYHNTPLPYELVISPRDVIKMEFSLSLDTDLSLEQWIALERDLEANTNYSTLVVPIGGVGTYPTMVAETTNLNWLVETISHEWIHNYFTFRPLGLRYNVTPQLRTMNETAASIAGTELGGLVIQKFYPELAPQPQRVQQSALLEQTSLAEYQSLVFDFRVEMHKTRVMADQLLAEGKIEEAEAYMEARRQVFWDNGYLIRRLNQAYFAFHGAYADQPGGAAGEDPVGKAVRQLRAKSPSLADFINTLSWMWNYQDLEQNLEFPVN
ncbi:MAG: hypothetical protein JXA19_03335 [Anaerolineales bacterium]|nr:hypothetical protein [Anaerolineales bacterium]